MKQTRSLAFVLLTGLLLTGCGLFTDTTAPVISSFTATPTTVTTPGTVTLTAAVTDESGVQKVDFYRGTQLIATDDSAPFTATDSVTAAQNGTVAYRAVATDTSGNTAEAAASVTVNIDATAPSVSLTVQPTTLTMPGTVTFTATASDDRGVIKVEFYDNGTLVSTSTSAPYTASKTYGYADRGVHTIKAVAYDAQGNQSESSATLNVNITDANEPNDSIAAATTLTLDTPVNGTIAGQPRDMDYFKFTAAAGDMLKLTVKSVSVDPASTLDPYVMILMPDGKTVLEKDDDSGAGLESEIRFNVPADGTYTVVVTSFDIHDDLTGKVTDDKATNTYQIALTRR